ncbi:MAG: hypothetical protein ACQETL_01615 [Bacteroidota bacterium]
MSERLNINIIYAEEDNKPIMQNRGWVGYFDKFLQMMLKQTMNREFQINLLSDAAKDSTLKDGVYIPILSPDFILSGESLDSLESLFLNGDSEKIHDRILPVFKSPLDFVDIPEKLRPLRAYIFYLDYENHEQELSDFFSKEAEKGYWMKMVDLCFDIYETVLKMSNEDSKGNNIHNRRAVYLADTGQDLAGARNIIKRELTRHGYEVYPKGLLPHNFTEMKKSITEDLKKCQFSIHMVGASYGSIPQGSDTSVMDIQNGLAADQSEERPHDFSRLIWISPSLKFASEKQKSFIHNIKRDAKASLGAEVLQTSLEDFKNTLWEELLDSGLNKKLRNAYPSEDQKLPIIYLIYDESDHKEAQKLISNIDDQQVNILTLDNKGDLMELRNKHIDALKQMDAAIVFQKNVNNQWVYMKLLDLLKAPGFGRSKPILGKMFKSRKAKGSESEYINRYEVEVDISEDSKKLNKFIKEIKVEFEKTQLEMAGDS